MVFFRFLSLNPSTMMRSVCSLLLLLTSAVLLSAAQPETKALSPRAAAAKAGEAKTVDYVLQPQDLIKIQVFQEDDLSRELRISQECTVQLPLIGTVNLTGKTARQSEEFIRDLYQRDYLTKPQVNLSVLEYAPRRVTVFGAVTTPGVVIFKQEQGLTLLEAISLAGSFNRLANKKTVTLKRTLPNGEAKTYTINVEELTKGETNETWPLEPDDVINVPERIL
jgi:polysaccharide export outer membrane protein